MGFHNFELLEKLIEKREIIKEQCKGINEKLSQQSQANNYKGKNMDHAPGSSVTVTYKTGGKKGKGPKAPPAENIKFNNYDVLLQLGFDKDFIDENRRLGLQEQNMQKAKQRQQYMMEHVKKQPASQVFEKQPTVK